jgi:hypothetical protein
LYKGNYEITDDISDLTEAAFLNGVHNKTEVLTRISTVGPERGSADTVRDFRGFAIKFKTMEGNNDWVFNITLILKGLKLLEQILIGIYWIFRKPSSQMISLPGMDMSKRFTQMTSLEL